MTPVRDHVDAITRQAALDAHVDPESDARQELASHLYDLARDRAAGRQVTRADIDAAWAELEPQAIYLLGGEESPSDAPTPATTGPAAPQSAPPPARGASWIPRLLAYVVDAVVVFAVTGLLLSIAIDPLSHAGDLLETVIIVAIMAAGPLIALRLETKRGGTPGKLLFNLRTIRENGTTPSWRQAVVITIPKLFPPLVALDALLGLLLWQGERVRLTERWAKVRVVWRTAAP